MNLQPEAAHTPRRTWRVEEFLAFAGPYLGLLLVLSLFSFLTWRRGELHSFLSLSNFQLVAVHAAIPAAVALGMTILMISGGIDLSVGNVVSLVTVTMALAYRWAVSHPIGSIAPSSIAVLVGLGTGVLAGLLNGLVITLLDVVPFVVTLGMMGIARGLAQYLSDGTRVTLPELPWATALAQIDPDPSWLVLGRSAWSVLLLAAVVSALLRYTVLGRYCYALGSNEATARLCGIRVERTKILLYTLAGLLTGWGGVLMLARSGAGSHDAASGLELEVIAAVVIGGGSLRGGEGKVSGTLVGALLITLLSNGCGKLQLRMETRFILIGLIIVAISAVNSWRVRRMQ